MGKQTTSNRARKGKRSYVFPLETGSIPRRNPDMALNYFRVAYRSRQYRPSGAAKHAAYIARGGDEDTIAVKQAQYVLRAEEQGHTAEDLVATGGRYPAWAEGIAAVLECGEEHERQNGRLCED